MLLCRWNYGIGGIKRFCGIRISNQGLAGRPGCTRGYIIATSRGLSQLKQGIHSAWWPMEPAGINDVVRSFSLRSTFAYRAERSLNTRDRFGSIDWTSKVFKIELILSIYCRWHISDIDLIVLPPTSAKSYRDPQRKLHGQRIKFSSWRLFQVDVTPMSLL